MGVNLQRARLQALVIDIGGGSTELMLAKILSDWWKAAAELRRISGGVINKENFQRARLAAAVQL